MSVGNTVADKLTGLGFSLAFQNVLPSFYPSDLMFGAVCGGIFKAVMYVRGKNVKKFRKDVEYGSARWGTPADIKPYIDPKPENNIILTATESLTMNSRPKTIKYGRNKNVLVIGGSGSGKTRFFVTPNLMQCQSRDYPVSFVVTDPNGTVQ